MGKIIKKISIAVALLSFVAVVVANRSGKFSIKPFDYGGELIPVSESTAVPTGVTPVRVGMFIENVYDFNVATQSIAADLFATGIEKGDVFHQRTIIDRRWYQTSSRFAVRVGCRVTTLFVRAWHRVPPVRN